MSQKSIRHSANRSSLGRPGKLNKLTQGNCEHTQHLRKAASELVRQRAKVEYVFLDIKIRIGYAKNR